jgi:hypothetical protein
MASRAEEYQRYARQCVQIAPMFQDAETPAILLGQAQAWLDLAHLAQANRHIAELTVEIVRQREIVRHALDTGQRSQIAVSVSLLDALEGSLRLLEKHRTFLLSLPQRNARRSAEWGQMKMLDKTEQSDRIRTQTRSRKVAIARHCLRGPACAYPAIRDGWPAGARKQRRPAGLRQQRLPKQSAIYACTHGADRPVSWGGDYAPARFGSF